jgi:hypothetical protein
MFEGQEQIQAGTVANFASEEEAIIRAVNRLRDGET